MSNQRPVHTVADWAAANVKLEELLAGAEHTFGSGYTYNAPYAVFYGTYGHWGYEVWSTLDGKTCTLLYLIVISPSIDGSK